MQLRSLLIIILMLVLSGYQTANAVVAKYAYVVNAYDSTVSMYTVDSDTGRLRNNGHVNTGRFPSSVIVHPSGRFVYVTEQTGMKVSAFSVNPSTGRLIELAGSPFDPKVVSPFWSAFDKSGKYLYIAGRNSNAVAAMVVDEKTGALSLVKGSPYPGGNLPRSVAVHPSDRFVYMTNINDDTVSGFRVNETSGELTGIPGSPFISGDAPQYIKIHPEGKYAFVSSWNSREIIVFEINNVSGALVEKYAHPLGEGVSPFGLAIHPNGQYLYVANWFGGTHGFSIESSTGKLTTIAGSPFINVGSLNVQVEVEPSGHFAYVTNYESNHVTAYTVNQETGALSIGKTTMARAGPRSIAFVMGEKPVELLSRFAYLADSDSNSVSVYKVNSKTGMLKSIAKANTGIAPLSISLDPLNRFLYVANSESNNISAFEINPGNGKLKEISGSPFRTIEQPLSILVDHNGIYVYITSSKSNLMSVFRIDAKSGALVELTLTDLYFASPYKLERQPGKLVLHPTARNLYTTNVSANNVSFFNYYDDGPLVVESEFGSPVEVKEGADAMVIEPNGLYAYIVGSKSNALAAYEVHVRSGNLLKLGKSMQTEKEPVSIALSPDGSFLYVVNKGSGSVSIYQVNTVTGVIKNNFKKVGGVGKDPIDIIMDPSGLYAYVINKGSKNIAIFSINKESGDLKRVGVINTGPKPVAMVMTSEIVR